MLNLFFIFGAKYLFLAVPILAVIYFLLQNKNGRKRLLILALFALPAIYIAGKIAGMLYFDQRPFLKYGFTPLIDSAADNGFPSDHTLFAAAISIIIYLVNKKWGAVLFFITLLVAVSRVYVGVHSALDVIGSVIIAIATGVLTNYFIQRWLKNK